MVRQTGRQTEVGDGKTDRQRVGNGIREQELGIDRHIDGQR